MWQSFSFRLSTRIAGLVCAGLIFSSASQAAIAQQGDDPRYLEAFGRCLGFLDSAPKARTFAVAVVYDAGVPSDRAAALNAAARLSRATGPHRSQIEAEAIDLASLSTSSRTPAALYLMPGSPSRSAAVHEMISVRKVITASADPACMQSGTCVLHIEAGRTVSIVLDTRLAESASAAFSTVFSMMVTRK